MKKSPCFNCPDRAVGCKTGCQRHDEWQDTVVKPARENREAQWSGYDIDDYRHKTAEKLRRKAGKKC